MTPNLQPRPGSPVINAGADVGLTEDNVGNPITGAPDIGAYEYTGEEEDEEMDIISSRPLSEGLIAQGNLTASGVLGELIAIDARAATILLISESATGTAVLSHADAADHTRGKKIGPGKEARIDVDGSGFTGPYVLLPGGESAPVTWQQWG
jgi:hypothetical protein